MNPSGGTVMQQIADWLEMLGLSEYAQRFAENDIDLDVLSELTDQDLEKLGVSLGHRRKMLRAIRALGSVTSVIGLTSAVTESQPQDTAERRQVTVMFADLVGSTALSAGMDPEDLREIISAYQKSVAESVRHFQGFVAKYMGDGVLVYFGYPHAHEDDAERAVQAGLELVAAVAALKSNVSLQTRVGIATGLVVVGDLIGSGEAQERGIVGETPNLAARLQGIAEPDQVVIAEGTRRLLGNLFELQDLRTKDLKGIPVSVQAWSVLRASSFESRFEAMHTTSLTALVGREEESDQLLRRWQKAKTGEGQVVLISGEPGIGKSRLAAALQERLGSEPHTRLRYFCSPQHIDSAFYPIIGQMERAAGFAHDDARQTRLDKLDAMLAETSTSIQDAELFAEMLSLRNNGRYPAVELAPQLRRQKTLEALISQLEALTRKNAVLMVFEDVHWIDPTSLEVLCRTINRIPTLRALLIVTFRPEFEPPWVGLPHVTALTINRLAKREIDAMIDRVVGDRTLPASIKQDIVERADGIPLFVEEMTKAVLEAESEGAARRAVSAVPSPTMAVPASLHASLMVRLDRLGSAKEVAQIGAVIGREFSHALLAAVVCKTEVELASALDRLIHAGLLFRQGMPPYATYLFKHALVQDAAYGTLLREQRRALHARIADTLEGQFPDIAESRPELLARHCTEAGQIEKAASLWGRAGLRSQERSALVEAVEQLTRALDQTATLPPTPSLRREQIKLQVGLSNALMHVKGYAAPETKGAIEQARVFIEQSEALGEPPEDPLLLFSALYGVWVVSYVVFNGDVCRDLAAQFLTLAEKKRATVPLLMAHCIMGHSLFQGGDFAQARTHYDKGIALYDPSEHRPLATRFGQDIQVAILSYRSLALWFLGFPEAALKDAENAVKYGRETGQAASLMFVLYVTAILHIHCGNYSVATAQAQELFLVADEKGALLWKASGMMFEGCVLASTGKSSEAIERLTAGSIGYQSTGATTFMTWFLSYLTRAYVELGQFNEAWRRVGEMMTAVQTTKESWWEADLHRMAGAITLMSPEPDATKAEAYFERALAVARQQQAKSWELRAAISMARLWRDQGKRRQAHDLLAPVYSWFTEGFNTLDLKEAKALLNDLAR
jgi:class 3 adenylate cyclase/predicted ATPase